MGIYSAEQTHMCRSQFPLLSHNRTAKQVSLVLLAQEAINKQMSAQEQKMDPDHVTGSPRGAHMMHHEVSSLQMSESPL